jgi:hypothetical protein
LDLELPGLAEDEAKFSTALALKSVKVDRAAALREIMIPEAALEREFAGHAHERALNALAHARAIDALEMRRAPILKAISRKFHELLDVIEEGERIDAEIRMTVLDPRARMPADLLHPSWIAWCVPMALRRRFFGWPFGESSIHYKPDLTAFLNERIRPQDPTGGDE